MSYSFKYCLYVPYEYTFMKITMTEYSFYAKKVVYLNRIFNKNLYNLKLILSLIL